MFLPLGDEPNPRGVPFVTYALIAMNCAVYLFITLPLGGVAPDPANPLLGEYVRVVADHLPANVSIQQVLGSISAYDLVVFGYGYRPADPHVATLFTAMFLHSGVMHLAGNMLFLWIYGDNVEHRLGAVRYLLWYLATGVAATLVHAWFNPSSGLPLVGASGAISGVLGFYFVWFPHNRVRLFVFLFPIIWNVFLVPARLVLAMFLIVENLLPFVIERGAGGVAYGAHIGGFVAGLAAAWVMERRDRSPRRVGFEVPEPEDGEAPGADLADLVARGRFDQAARAYFGLPPEASRRVLAPGDSLALAHWLITNGHARAALVVYQRHLRDYPLGPGTAEAHAGAGLVQLHALGQPTAAYQHFVEALEHDPPAETERLVRAGLAEIAARQKFQISSRAR